jgi:Flp pilus assembly protein TadG
MLKHTVQPVNSSRTNKGQALILVALAFVALLSIVGLAIDLGRYFIVSGSLRRAVDAASLAAASQFREGRSIAEMTAMAEQAISMNGVAPETVVVTTCRQDVGLCQKKDTDGTVLDDKRKYVRVVASASVDMTFLQLVGVPSVSLSSESTAEAASVEVVLIIDISESMTSDASLCDGGDDDGDGEADDGRPANKCKNTSGGYLSPIAQVGTTADNYYQDPSVCNPAKNCHPFEEVRSAAQSFVYRVLDLSAADETDRLALVTFSNGWQSGVYGTQVWFPASEASKAPADKDPWIRDKATALDLIDNFLVYEPPDCNSVTDTTPGPCRNYDSTSGIYTGTGCGRWYNPALNDPGTGNGEASSCTTTNIGGGLLLGGNLYANKFTRKEALWVSLILTDGAANASFGDGTTAHQYGFCPVDTWAQEPFCRDWRVSLGTTRHTNTSLLYDSDDYARDNADFLGCYAKNSKAAACPTDGGQGAIVFSIGLGDQVLKKYKDPSSGTEDPVPPGSALLRYIAAVGDDGDPATDPCSTKPHDSTTAKCGNYYFAPSGAQLDQVFEDIASRIFTRLSH